MADPYKILGVSREATHDDIRKAYRRLARQNHPDLHPGDNSAETRFKDIAAAHAIVGDEKKRVRFDRGEIDASGTERAPETDRGSYRQHADTHPGFKYAPDWHPGGLEDGDLFAELFGARQRARIRGSDITYTFTVPFIEAVNGAKRRVIMGDSKTLDITIPQGLKDGQTLRLRGQGNPGIGGAEPGDVLVTVHVSPHPQFRRDGNDIRSTLPVTLGEALAGAKILVATIAGAVQLQVPRASNTGTILRMRGKGVATQKGTGDHLVELKVILPDEPDDDFVRSVTDWEAKHPYDPRKSQEAKV